MQQPTFLCCCCLSCLRLLSFFNWSLFHLIPFLHPQKQHYPMSPHYIWIYGFSASTGFSSLES
jgi:hypothetical protein